MEFFKSTYFVNLISSLVIVHTLLTMIVFFFFQLSVSARDQGTPQLTSSQQATVIITVVRNNFAPVFQNTPYSRDISQGTSAGTSVFQVTATDADTVSSEQAM